MGTPDFAVPALEALVNAGHEAAAVVTQPDKPKGRGKAVLMTPVKEKALEYEMSGVAANLGRTMLYASRFGISLSSPDFYTD